MMPANLKKRQRLAAHPGHSSSTTSRVSSTAALIVDNTLSETSHTLRRSSSHPLLFAPLVVPSSSSSSSATFFNDHATADVVLRLFLDNFAVATSEIPDYVSSTIDDQSDVQIYLHSNVICRAKYFAALLSDRWQSKTPDDNSSNEPNLISVNLPVSPAYGSIDTHLKVLRLLYNEDFETVITSPSVALDILPVALELLYEDCVKSCVKFLEAVPWSEEEEKRVLNLVPFLSADESEELLARLSPDKNNLCEEMLHGLIMSAMYCHLNIVSVKAFVAKLLRDFSSKETARRVLERAFESSLKSMKESWEEYSNPDFRVDHNETEAIQRVNLHTALTNGRHLLWLIERMVELRVADNAVKEWSEQAAFTADLQRAFRDDSLRNIVPGLPAVVLRCTCKLASAVAAGSVLAARQVRVMLVREWLPVLIVCKDSVSRKDSVSPMQPNQKPLYLELEVIFLRIISTLPLSDAQELLQQCLSFTTRNVEDCPHLVTAFNTWFRRAAQQPRRNNLD